MSSWPYREQFLALFVGGRVEVGLAGRRVDGVELDLVAVGAVGGVGGDDLDGPVLRELLQAGHAGREGGRPGECRGRRLRAASPGSRGCGHAVIFVVECSKV